MSRFLALEITACAFGSTPKKSQPIGQPPMSQGVSFQLTVNAQGRLVDEQEFGDVVIKSGMDGQVTHVRDVARVELAARDYSMDSKLNGQPNASLGIFQLPGSNSIETSDGVHA